MTLATQANTKLITGRDARSSIRNDQHLGPTAGIAPRYLQANLIVLPSRYAEDFETLCARNPVPCPLIARSKSAGCFDEMSSCIAGLTGRLLLSEGSDVRRDIPRYMVYKNSELERSHCKDIVTEWTQDHIAFLIGCSYSFETELSEAGLEPRHVVLGRNVPMYRTTLPLCPAGIFTGGTYVVSMRPYKRQDIEKVRDITRLFTATHGEPIDWGWEAIARLGIRDIDRPEWGDAPLSLDGKPFGSERGEESEDIPVFWGCGVTPQEAVMRAGLVGRVMAHAPGHMLVLDARDQDILGK